MLLLALFPVAAAADYAHLVQPGETLTSVAATDGLSIEAIAQANGISPNAELIAGQTLLIPPQTPSTAATANTAAASTTAVGSTATSEQAAATSVAQTQSTATSASASSGVDADGDRDRSSVSTSRVAHASASAQASATTASTTQTATASGTATASSTATASGPVPTPERVSAAQIASVASAYGVPANLAEAVAWQESGWNNAEVSSVGAVGVMQIVPSTWSWIDTYLTPSDPLGPASATENIRAGVLLLRQLLGLTGGNQPLAVAGYFQGLSSVRAVGMYRSTRQYVADVLALAQRL
ncbi:MAG TPA: transglycosylase SLT domain-containing protein [Solirubrobacteraceae bacterium]|nr:transglycosylase SLT domain-containing protein [Solirubrobacteraceae bacterium]